jgi:hypothetical protein
MEKVRWFSCRISMGWWQNLWIFVGGGREPNDFPSRWRIFAGKMGGIKDCAAGMNWWEFKLAQRKPKKTYQNWQFPERGQGQLWHHFFSYFVTISISISISIYICTS